MKQVSKLPLKRTILIMGGVVALGLLSGILIWRVFFWQTKPQVTTSPPPSNDRQQVTETPQNTPVVPAPPVVEKQPPSNQTPQPAKPSVASDGSYHIVVNKKHPLSPITYTPSDLVSVGSQKVRTAPADAIRQMQTDSGAGIPISPASGYRSYQTQVTLYNSYVNQYGQARADTFSARPGYSEHQTGLAMDFSPIDDSFAATPQFTWLQASAYKYGFILRYPNNKTDVTGYKYEPWHWRYVGVDIATDMHAKNILTLEEYYGVSGGDY